MSPAASPPDGRIVALGVAAVGVLAFAAWWFGRTPPATTIGTPVRVGGTPVLGPTTGVIDTTGTVAAPATGAAALAQTLPLPDLDALAASPAPSDATALAAIEATALRQLGILGYDADPTAAPDSAGNAAAVAAFDQAYGLAPGAGGLPALRAAVPAIDAIYRQGFLDAGTTLTAPAGRVPWWQ